MASSSSNSTPVVQAWSTAAVAVPESFATYLTHGRSTGSSSTVHVQPGPVVMHHELLIPIRCRHCNKPENLGPARVVLRGDPDPQRVAPASSAALPVQEVASGGHPALDVVATRGNCLDCAEKIFWETCRLVRAVNVKGDTALHCTARAQNLRMVCHLVSLAGQADGHEAAEAALRRQNGRGETALHDAVRSGNKDLASLLLWVDQELARFPEEGTSPLYLAVCLRRPDIVKLLWEYRPLGCLSYSGPDGQTVLHAAVLRDEWITRSLLNCEPSLAKKGDRHGSTPLHFAASVERGLYYTSSTWIRSDMADSDELDMLRFSNLQGSIKVLLATDPSSAYLPDNQGSFPIHGAASSGKVKLLHILIATSPTSAGLRDGKGRTFLHVAVENRKHKVVEFVCQEPELAWVLNAQDDEGNTAVHLAVRAGDLRSFCYLMQNHQVGLNMENNKGLTPLDVSCCHQNAGMIYGMDPHVCIHRMLTFYGAEHGIYRWDQFEEECIPKLDAKKEAKKIAESTNALAIGAVLVATATFAAAFTMPGGYRADDHANGGAPTRAGRYSFDAFVISNTLAFTLSCLATTLLVSSGTATVDLHTRLTCLRFSVSFLVGAARSFCVAFALGVYVVLSPVARPTAIASCVITSFTLLDTTLFGRAIFAEGKALLRRLGIQAWCRLGKMILLSLLSECWPYILIFGLPAVLKIHGRT